MKKNLFVITVILLCACAAGLFLYCTPYGVGLTNDSASYIGGARSLLSGQGYVRIAGDGLPRSITHFPPFYSLVLAGMAKLTGQDPLEAAKIVNLLCVVLNQLLFMLVLRELTASNLTAFAGGIAFLCAGPVLHGSVYGLSEALYLTLFLAVFLLSLRCAGQRRTGMWLVIGLPAGLIVLTRYAGFAVIAALFVYALCVLPNLRERLLSAALLLAGFCVPFGTWYFHNRGNGSSVANRVISVHLPAVDKIEEGVIHFIGFFLPEYGGWIERCLRLCTLLSAAALILLTAAVIISALKKLFHPSADAVNDTLFPPALHAAAYMAMLWANVSFIDGSTLFDDRILLPFYVCVMLLLYAAAALCLRKRKILRVIAVIFMICWPLVLFEDEYDLIREYHRDGQGFAGREWTESETAAAAKNLPAGHLLWCNRQTYLSLMNNQPAFILPPMFDAANSSERDSFEADRNWMKEEVLAGNGYVIVFNYWEMMEDEGDSEWLNLVLQDLPVLSAYSDGVIFGKTAD